MKCLRLSCCLYLILILTQQTFALEKVAYESHSRNQALVHAAYTMLNINGTQGTTNSFRPSFNYYFNEKIALDVGYLTMPDQQGQMLLSGYDVGVKWYLFSPGSESEKTGNGMYMRTYSVWSHYLIAGYRSRQLHLADGQVGYSGIGYGYGVNWNFGRAFSLAWAQDFSFSSEAVLEDLSSQAKETIELTHIAFGLGLHL